MGRTTSNPSASIVRRTMLFVPANRPDRFGKAAASGADAYCIDLEDAVAPDQKEDARKKALPLLAAPNPGPARRLLRLNPLRTDLGKADLRAVLDAGAKPDGIVLPKVGSGDELRDVEATLAPHLKQFEIYAMIEGGQGLEAIEAIADATPRLTCLVFGAADYAAEIGATLGWDALLYARSRMVAAAGRRGLDAMDGVWFELDDEKGLREETKRISALGFTGKNAVHPKQIAPIHDAFRPSPEAVEKARRIVQAFEASPDGVLTVDGRMIDEPLVASARRTLAIANR